MLNILHFDITLKILYFLDVKSALSLFLTCKYTYTMLQEHIVTKVLIEKLLTKLRLTKTNVRTFTYTKEILNDLYKIHSRFKKCHKSQNIVDKIHYTIENNLSNATFNILLSQKFNISNEDLEYIILHCTYLQLKLVIQELFVPRICLQHALQSLESLPKIQCLLDYMFYKFAFPNFDSDGQDTLDTVCLHFIKQNNIQSIKYVIMKSKQYNHDINYQFLLNSCIVHRNLSILKHVSKSATQDNSEYVIHTSNIYWLCVNGEFDILDYVIRTHLTRLMNNELYHEIIFEGLRNCNKPISEKNFNMLSKHLYLKKLNLNITNTINKNAN